VRRNGRRRVAIVVAGVIVVGVVVIIRVRPKCETCAERQPRRKEAAMVEERGTWPNESRSDESRSHAGERRPTGKRWPHSTAAKSRAGKMTAAEVATKATARKAFRYHTERHCSRKRGRHNLRTQHGSLSRQISPRTIGC